MTTNPAYYSIRDTSMKASDNLRLAQKYAILEGLYHEARTLGHFKPETALRGIEEDVRLVALLQRICSNLSSQE